MEILTTIKNGNGIAQPTRWCSNSKRLVILSRGVLKQKKGRISIDFNGDSMNTELLFRTVHSVNQISVHGAEANWCYKFVSTEDEKGRTISTVDNKILTKLKPEEVQLLVSPSTQATGNKMQERVSSFDEQAVKIQLAQLCEKTFSRYLVTSTKTYKIRPNADDG